MQFKSFMEALKGNQHKIDKNKNGKVDAHDFKLLRKEEEELEEAEQIDELSKGTLASYAKKATNSARITQSIGKDFEASANKSRKPGMKDAAQSLADKYKSKSRSREAGVGKAIDRLAKEEFELDEAMINGREYASHGLMHPDHAAHSVHKVTGNSVDFYAHGTGDKVEGKVIKNDGKAVHIKDTKGTTHKFKVQRGLPKQQNEEKKSDVPFDGPYTKTKPVKNSDGTTQQPMSRARQLAKDAMKKQMKEDIDRLFEKDASEYDNEGEMAVTQLKTIVRHAEALQAKMQPDTNLPEWVQSKITLATDYIQTASDYLHSELEEQAPVAPSLMKHRISVTVSDPDHTMVSKRKEKMQKTVVVTHSSNKEGAQKVGEKFYKKKGYIVHDSHHAGMVNEEVVKEETNQFDAEGNLMAEKLKFSDFIDKVNEQLLEYESDESGVYRHTKKATYGTSYQGDDDEDEKKPKQQPAEKRGRGRPAGSKIGARKITGTSKLYK